MPALMSTLKIIDAAVGNLVARLLPIPAKRNLSIPERFLVIRPGGMGDAVLLSAAIRSIRKSFPDAFISVLAERRNAAVFSLMSEVNEVFCYDRSGELIQVLLNKYDVVIDTEQWYYLSAVVARLVRAPMKIGYATNQRRRMFNNGIQYDADAYEADNFLSLLAPLKENVRGDDDTVSLALPAEAVSRVHLLLQLVGTNPFVVIFPGASIPEKRWGASRFSQLSRSVVEAGYQVVVVGGRGEVDDGNLITDGGGLNLAGMTTLAETAAVIARSTMVISGDSGVLHLAVGLGIPTVSLFGPSSAAKWAPKGERHVVINHHLPCSPCSKFGNVPSCPINARCINEITSDEVIEAVCHLLPQPPK